MLTHHRSTRRTARGYRFAGLPSVALRRARRGWTSARIAGGSCLGRVGEEWVSLRSSPSPNRPTSTGSLVTSRLLEPSPLHRQLFRLTILESLRVDALRCPFLDAHH